MDGTQVRQYPVVLRFEGMFPHQMGKFQKHGQREIGDLSHIDWMRFDPNHPPLIGKTDWLATAQAEIEWMRSENFGDEMASLERRNRKADIIRRMSEGAKDPWRPSRHGPMRELILTANKAFFEAGAAVFDDERSVAEDFRDLSVAWLKKNFGDDCIFAREDVDEEAYHIHAIIMPRIVDVMTRTDKKTGEKKEIARRYMLQPSKHPLIEDYEAAQDSVGQWFASLGLVRGERRKKAWREAVAKGEAPAKKRRHIKPRVWREQEEARLAKERRETEARKVDLDRQEAETIARKIAVEQREGSVAEREEDAEAIVTIAEAIAQGVMEVDDAGQAKVSQERADEPEAASAIAASQRRPKTAQRLFATLGKAVSKMRGDLSAQVEAEVRAEYQDAFNELAAAGEVVGEIVEIVEPSLRAVAQSKMTDLRTRLAAAGRFAARAIVGRERRAESAPKTRRTEKRNER